MPKNRSAYLYLQSALEIDPENALARRGLKRIGERYAVLANRALKEESYDKAGRYVDRPPYGDYYSALKIQAERAIPVPVKR